MVSLRTSGRSQSVHVGGLKIASLVRGCGFCGRTQQRQISMKTFWLLSISLQAALSAGAFGASPSPSTETSPVASIAELELNPAQKLAAAVLASVRANNERLQGVELTVTKDFQDRSVQKETVVRESLPNGGEIVSTRRPAARIVERAVVLDDRVRFETSGSGKFPKVTYWFDGLRWTRSDGNGQKVSRMRTDQLGGKVVDPREVVGVDPRASLANVLSPRAVENATVETEGTISTITAETAGGRLAMGFDSAVALLPTKTRQFHPDGGLIREIVVEYVRVPERDAWVIQQTIEHIFDLSASMSQAPTEWKQEMRTSIAHKTLDRAVAERELAVQIPEGAPVFDFTDDSAMARKPRPPVAERLSAESPLKWFIVAHVVLITAAGGFYLLRRLRSRTVRLPG